MQRVKMEQWQQDIICRNLQSIWAPRGNGYLRLAKLDERLLHGPQHRRHTIIT